jgi:hypothetical protein
VALFFQQAILCYQMDAFEFVAGKAVDQIGVSKTLCVKSEDDQRIFLKREAAHSSTLPTLIAIPKDGSLPEGFVYLKGGFSHYQHNSTIGMSVAVNGADEVIDGKRPTEGLRGASIRIINRVASGLDPVKATRVFISTFKEILDSLIEERREKEDQKDVYEVIKYYKKRIEKIERALATDDLFDQLLGVIIDNEDPRAKKIHRIVYKKRYDIIRLQEIIESRIAKRIEDVKEQMGRSKSRLEFLLLKQFMGKEEKIILEKLFAKTAAIFEENYPQAQDSKFKSFVTSIDHKKDELAPLLRSLFDNLRIDFRELSCAEFTYRSTLFRQLRIDVCNWTQKEFIEQFKEINNSEISASWVSRMEQLGRLPYKQEYKTPTGQRRSYITLDVAQKCAKTFDIDPGLFLPSLFTSS